MALNAKTVLVIDDEQANAQFIEKVLGRQGVDVVVSTGPAEGIEQARLLKPDLIFISLLLGQSNGLKVSKEIHASEALRQVPIILFVSYKGELDPKYTSTIGIVDVLVKPLKEKEFLLKVQAYLGGMPSAETEPAVPDSGDEFRIQDDIVVLEDEAEAVEEDLAEIEVAPLSEEDEPLSADVFEIAEEQDESPVEFGEPLKIAEPEAVPEETTKDLSSAAWPAFDEEGSGPQKAVTPAPAPEEEFPGPSDDIEPRSGLQPAEPASAAETYSYEPYAPKKSGPSRPVLIALIAAIGVVGIVIGVFFMKKFTSSPDVETALQKPVPAARPEEKIVPDNLPPQAPSETAPQKGETPVKQIPFQEAKSAPSKTETPAPAPDVTKQAAPKPPAAAPQPQTAKETVKKTAKTAPAATPKAQPFSLQVGVFSDLKNATALAEQLKKKGYAVAVKDVAGSGAKPMHRVTVGAYASKAEAGKASEELLRKEGLTSFIRAD